MDSKKPALDPLPTPIKVELLPHDPQWAVHASEVAETLQAALGATLLKVHHIGSTALPGIVAKPVLDLIPEVTSLTQLDARQALLEALGYIWHGERGLPGRRYCSKDDPVSGRRLVQLHCYAQGSPEIERHLAFRNYLRRHPDLARAYEQEKIRCQALHPHDSHAYSDCKDAWIKRVQAQALRNPAIRRLTE
ncbi:GrpB family protein [Pseudomonas sp. Fl5BN2]|uniref:GrpB family protein n=1 Tax=Pseudomonas sp. Fl5BN2 TaxID=2697652 RepID=UPI001C49A446|nr:GrpB family protein [Pseudomonas sp. Fl5BN2]